MATYCLTFRIANVTASGSSYSDRYQSLIDNVRTRDGGFWEETTSFFLVESPLDTTGFVKNAVRGLSAKHDMLFAFDPADMSACYFGDVEHVDVLKSFFPLLMKVG